MEVHQVGLEGRIVFHEEFLPAGDACRGHRRGSDQPKAVHDEVRELLAVHLHCHRIRACLRNESVIKRKKIIRP